MLLGRLEDHRAFTLETFTEGNALVGSGQQLAKPGSPFFDWAAAQILTVEMQQVECEVDEASMSATSSQPVSLIQS